MRIARPLLTAGLVVCLAFAGAAQQPTFRSSVDVVELDVIVTDASGNLVSDLTADDFEVREQGKAQAITSFTHIDIPIEKFERPLFAGREIEPDVQSNDAREGRVYVIAFDAVSPSDGLKTRRFLRGFIEQHFGANDVAAIVYLGRARRDDAQDLTSSRPLLLAAIDKFAPMPSGSGDLPVTNPTLPGTPSNEEFEARNEQRLAMRSFRELVEFMATLHGRRKSLLYISQGWPYDVFNAIDYNGGVLDIAGEDAHAALRAATRGNVTIYTIDPRGLTIDGAGGETEEAPQVNRLAALQNRSNLRALAEVTGGFGFINQNDFNSGFERIVRENSTYYLLGYSPTDERRDGRYRKLDVRVKRPGLQVRARAGYLAPRGNPQPPRVLETTARVSAPVREAVASAIRTSGVPLRVFAAPFKGSGKEASVPLSIELDARDLDLAAANGVRSGEIEVGFIAIDQRNRVTPGRFHRGTVTLKGDGATGPQTVRVLEEVRLAPGRYQIRVAAATRLDRTGSVVYDVEVPDFTKAPLVMSGVALTSRGTAGGLTFRQRDPLRDHLPGAPTTAREFDRSDTVALFAEVYDNLRSEAGHTVRITAELQAEGGTAAQSVSDERSSKDLQGSSGGYGFRAEFPLNDVEPGRYVIHVEARANAGDRPAVARDVVITVR